MPERHEHLSDELVWPPVIFNDIASAEPALAGHCSVSRKASSELQSQQAPVHFEKWTTSDKIGQKEMKQGML